MGNHADFSLRQSISRKSCHTRGAPAVSYSHVSKARHGAPILFPQAKTACVGHLSAFYSPPLKVIFKEMPIAVHSRKAGNPLKRSG